MSDASAVSVDIRRGEPTPDELAAVLAVVSVAFAEEAAGAVVSDLPRRSRWKVAARGLRRPLARELGWSGSAW